VTDEVVHVGQRWAISPNEKKSKEDATESSSLGKSREKFSSGSIRQFSRVYRTALSVRATLSDTNIAYMYNVVDVRLIYLSVSNAEYANRITRVSELLLRRDYLRLSRPLSFW